LEFKLLIRDVAAPVEQTKPQNVRYDVINSTSRVADVGRARAQDSVTRYRCRELAGQSDVRQPGGNRCGFEPEEAVYMPFGHQAPGELALGGPTTGNLAPITSLSEWVAVLEDPNIRKIGHNLKHDYLVLKRAGITLRALNSIPWLRRTSWIRVARIIHSTRWPWRTSIIGRRRMMSCAVKAKSIGQLPNATSKK
jgi:DNA polymerase-1